jgi:hypothetical protein
MKKAIIILLGLSLAVAVSANEKIQTREQLFAPITDPALNPERRYAELDLNGDGTNDLILSESVSLGGTGGLVYNLYLGVGQDRFRQIDRFLAGIMATETHGGTTRLWFYSHMSAGSGTIQYRYFDRKGIFQTSQYLMIFPGDGGSDTGNGIYQAIFNEKTILKMQTIGAANKAPEETARKLAHPQG